MSEVHSPDHKDEKTVEPAIGNSKHTKKIIIGLAFIIGLVVSISILRSGISNPFSSSTDGKNATEVISTSKTIILSDYLNSENKNFSLEITEKTVIDCNVPLAKMVHSNDIIYNGVLLLHSDDLPPYQRVIEVAPVTGKKTYLIFTL